MMTAAQLIQHDEPTIKNALSSLNSQQMLRLSKSWRFWARPSQVAPDGDWTTWMFLGGRGTGKTRSGAEWVKETALAHPGIRMALVAPTKADVRDTMIRGVSGLMSLHWDPGTRPRHIPSNRMIVWPNGSMAHTYSAEEPDRLRGPQFHVAWADELAAWRYLQTAWDMLSFGLRLEYPGFSTPRTFISTTPRPIALLRELLTQEGSVVTRGSTYENRANLSPKYFKTIVSRYEGSRLGRQELLGELIEDLDGALWRRENIKYIAPGAIPPLSITVISVDPATSDKVTANECGIVGCALGQDGKGYVLGDFSTHAANPAAWGRKVIEAFKHLKASYVVVEGNLAGGLVETVLKQIDPNIPLKFVQAQRGKYLRAEPVAMLYEQDRIRHVGVFPGLEDQMCRFTPMYQKENPGQSPDRVDALVWGLAGIMLESYYDSSMRWAAN
jgi:phage terminase large subunit-like protein